MPASDRPDTGEQRGLSGSIDVTVVGALIALPSYYFDVQAGVAIGLVLVVVGLAKVGYDHLFGFEDPLGIDNIGGGDER